MADARRPSTWRWAGCAGALALAAASWGSGALPRPNTGVLWPGVAGWSAKGGSPLLATVSVLALALLVVAWWKLREADVDQIALVPGIGPRTATAIKDAVANADATRKTAPKEPTINTATGEILED